MATDLDDLQIQITSSSREAEEAIDKLVKGLENLNTALGNLDVKKITSFTNAVSKLSQIGQNTNIASKAVKTMAKDIATSFGIRTKKGVDDITYALQQMIEASKSAAKGDDIYGEKMLASESALQRAIKSNYRYVASADDVAKSVKNYVDAFNKGGGKIGMGSYQHEFGDDFKDMQKILGSGFKNVQLSTKEGYGDLASFLAEMNSVLGTDFDTYDPSAGLRELVKTLERAKDTVYDYNAAVKEGVISNVDLDNASSKALKQIFEMIAAMQSSGVSDGLGGIIAVFQQISNINIPNMDGVVSALKQTKKASDDIGATAPKVDDVASAIDDISTAANSATPAANDLANALMVISNNTQLMPQGTTDLSVYERALPAIREISNFQPPDLSTAIVQMDEYVEYIYRALAGMRALEDKRPGLPDKYYDPIDTTGEWVENNPPDLYAAVDSYAKMQQAAEGARRATERLGNSIKLIADNYGNVIDSTGEWVETNDQFKKAENSASKFNSTLSTSASGEFLHYIVELGEGLEKLAEHFEKLSEKGVRLFETLITPLKWAANEYVEKFEHMQEAMKDFQKKFQARMDKMSQFWKRTMKTFTFMLVRKAIDAIVKEVGTAIQSLAMYSNAMGTAFNTDLSNMVADFQYLGRSIVSIFAPLLNVIIPIIDAIVDRIATLLSYIGMLFAALGGSTSFTKAKKNVGNYAESLDQASKSAKNLTMGIDELNILSEGGGGGSSKPYDGWEDAWEEVDIPRWVLDIADWFKKFWDRFFAPLLEAWNRAKQYLIDGFKTMLNSLQKLLGHVVDDFLTMWNQEKTIRMFEQILRIAGDLMRVVRNLANGFDDAWQKGKVGLKIFENIRDIVATLVDHVRNVSYYMIGWADEIDFYPMLAAFEELTKKLVKLADFIGGVFEDVMIYGVLKYIEFMINDAIPHLLETVGKIVDAFDFPKLRDRLQPVIVNLEEMLERIHTGVTNAIGNLGVAIAKFVNSDEFAKFLERIVEVSKEITSERVEKILTGIGEGIINIGKAVVKFVSSDTFMKFIKAIGEWIDKKSTSDIAKVLEGIAKAIVGFKFAAFTTSKLAGFFKFFGMIVSVNKLATIAKHLTGVAEATSKLGGAAPLVSALNHPISTFSGLISTTHSNFSTLVGSFKNLSTLGVKGIFEGITASVTNFAASLSPVVSILGSIAVGFLEFKGVRNTVSELASGVGFLEDNIAKLVGQVGLAAGAFTLLLGFPAGIIASGVVAAIAAIKGIQDAIEQINFDVLNNAIISGGDTTLAQAKEWYDEATSIVTEQTQKWVDNSRNLTQASADIQEYISSIGGLSDVVRNSKDVTVEVVDILVGKYSDLKGAIENYIDQSTDSLVSNLMAQKGYLESQGINVNQMILDIYNTANSTKQAVSEAQKGVEETAKKYAEAVETYGEGSDEAVAALDEFNTAMAKSDAATSQFNKTLGNVKTDEAVEEIKALGNSLDLSEFAGDPEGAVKAIQEHIDTLKSTYVSKLKELSKARNEEIKNIEANPLWSDAYKAAEIASVQQTYSEMSDTLTTETNKVFGLYQNTIISKAEEVAKQASQTWDEKGGDILGYSMLSKSDFIHAQLENFVETMLGEEGLEGSINKMYEQLPGEVNENAVTAMNGVVENTYQAFTSAMTENGSYSVAKAQQYDMLQSILNQTDSLDYNTPASTFTTNAWSTIMNHARGIQYDEYGKVLIGETAKAVTNTTQDFEDAMRMVSGKGVNAFSDEHKKEIAPLADAMTQMGLTSGENFDLGFIGSIRQAELPTQLEEESKPWGVGLTTGLNAGIEEGMETTEPVIHNWFRQISDWIHDNPYMPFGSPNQKTKEYGGDLVSGLVVGIDEAVQKGTVTWSITRLFSSINKTMTEKFADLKTNFNTLLSGIFTVEGVNIGTSIETIFTNAKTAIVNGINSIGNELASSILPAFMQTYILPLFSVEIWQPYFDILLNEVFMVFFDTFRVWFMDEAMTPWWNEDVLSWFATEKWNEEIFKPLAENISKHFEHFVEWWDSTMEDWWKEHLIPWFDKEKWEEQFKHVLDVSEDVFDLVKEAIEKRISDAADAVVGACDQMKTAIAEVLSLIGEMSDALEGFNNFEGTMTFDFGTPKEFAEGGFPSEGTLFFAGERGAEFVSNIGGKTGVVSNDEITGIADAVYTTSNQESALLAELISLGRAMLDKDPVVISDREIARMNNSGQGKLGMSIIT